NIILNRDKLENLIKSSSEIFFSIYFMNKIEISIDKLIEKVSNLKELNILELNSNGLSIIPKESPISKLEELCSQLILKDNKFNEFPESIVSLTKLKLIKLKNN